MKDDSTLKLCQIMSIIKEVKKENIFIIGVAGLLLLIVYFVGFLCDMRGDAVRYASISQEMIHSHHFLELQNRGGEPYLQKPPFLFWIGYLSFSIFDISNISFKIPVFLISLLGVFFAYKLTRLYYSKEVARLASLFLLASFGFIFYHNDIHTDTVLMSCILLAIWQLSLFMRNQRFIHLITGFLGLGLAMLTKGPIGLAIPVFALGTDLLLKRDWKNIFRWQWLAGLFLLVLFISPALLGLYRQFGFEGLKFYFLTNMTGRITGSLHANNSDYFYYFHTLFWEFIPWGFFIFYGFFMEIRKLAKNRFSLPKSEEALNSGGIIIFFLIISISQFKGPNYLIPLFPFFAILGSKWTIELFQSEKNKVKNLIKYSAYFLTGILWLAVFWIFFLNIKDLPLSITVLLPLILLFSVYLIFRPQESLSKLLQISLFGLIALGFLYNSFISPLTYQYHAMKQASNIVNNTHQTQQSFLMIDSSKPKFSDDSFNFYLEPEPVFTSRLKDGLELKKGWVFTNERDYQLLENMGVNPRIVYEIPHLRFMNLQFLSPKTRDEVLKKYYLFYMK